MTQQFLEFLAFDHPYRFIIHDRDATSRAGLDAANYSGHSLRAGHATSAAIAGTSERSIINQTGHRSVQMVRRYIRDGSLFWENSAGKIGL
jgi:integrase